MNLELTCVVPKELSSVDHQAWQELAVPYPFNAEAWFTSWVHGFNPAHPRYLCAYRKHRLSGVAPLQVNSGRIMGHQLRSLRSLTNVWSFRFEFIGSMDAVAHLWSSCLDSSKWDTVHLEKVAEDSITLKVAEQISSRNGWKIEAELQLCSPCRPLPSAEEGWDTGLSTKFKRNLRSRERRLASEGEVDFRIVQSKNEKVAALEAFYALEAAGWKGRQGTAICQVPEARILFDELVKSGGDYWLPILSFNGRFIAAQIVHNSGSRLSLLKTAYDPEYSAFSPGQLITARVMALCVDLDIEEFDFLGDRMDWKMDWEPQLRKHYRLDLYAPTVAGRIAHWRDHKLRHALKMVPGAVPAVRWLRRKKGRP